MTKRDQFPLPKIDETLDALGGAKWFTTLDLASGYHQVAMEEEDKEKTAFVCPFGLFEWNRLPFGLCGAPATFQRLMQRAMSGFLFEFLLIYLDDLLIYSGSFKEHLISLRKIMNRIREIGVKLNPAKCQLARQEVKFLGHKISAEGISTDPDKLIAVNKWDTPKTLKEVRQFMGLASYYRKFVPNFATIARPLHQLMHTVHTKYPNDQCKGERKTLGELWDEECDIAFTELKRKLVSPPILAYADYTKEFILNVDACNNGLGAVLSQKNESGQEQVIAYASRTVRPAEVRVKYSAMKLELLALKWAITEKFRGYLLGSKFIVYTDSNPLAHLNTAKFGAVEQRWIAELGAFDFQVKYKPGRNNQNADSLSRNPLEDTVSEREELFPVSFVSANLIYLEDLEVLKSDNIDCILEEKLDNDMLIKSQENDPDLLPIINMIKNNKFFSKSERKQLSAMSKSLLRQQKKLIIHNGLLKRKQYDTTGKMILVIIIPCMLRSKVMRFAHESNGHQGIPRTLSVLKTRCYWPHMALDVADYGAKCQRCQVSKKPATAIFRKRGHIVANGPLEVITLDFLNMDVSSDGTDKVLILTDVFSKWAMAIPIQNETAETVTKVLLQHWIVRFGAPLRIHSDRGKGFDAQILTLLCQAYQIKQSRTTAYNPSGNGISERFNRSLIDLIKALLPEKKLEWPKYLNDVVFCYNSTKHATTGLAPYEILFGREPRLPIDMFLGDMTPAISEGIDMIQKHVQRVNKIRKKVRDNISHQHQLLDVRDNKTMGIVLKLGDLVLIKNHPTGRHKLADTFKPQPWKVIGIPGETGGPFIIEAEGIIKRVTGSEIRRFLT